MSGIKTAHASASFDQSSHLPSALSAEFAVTIPADLQKDASGLTAVDFKVDATFSDWNSDFSVSAPSGATPLNAGGLFGGLAPAAVASRPHGGGWIRTSDRTDYESAALTG